jgi:hypothetical protein
MPLIVLPAARLIVPVSGGRLAWLPVTRVVPPTTRLTASPSRRCEASRSTVSVRPVVPVPRWTKIVAPVVAAAVSAAASVVNGVSDRPSPTPPKSFLTYQTQSEIAIVTVPVAVPGVGDAWSEIV